MTKYDPLRQTMALPLSEIVIGVCLLWWVASKEPRLRGGKRLTRPLRIMIAMLGFALIGFGTYGVYVR